MKKTTTEVLTPREAKAAAVARVLARRRPPRYASAPNPLGGAPFRWQVDGGELSEPRTISEWADDRLARSAPGTPVTDLLIRIFELVRDGGAAAVPAAVSLAAGLDDSAAFSLFMVLNAVPTGPDGIGSALVREWQRRGLRTIPAPQMPIEPIDRSRPSEQARRVTYRTPHGHNAA
jgi:hypothetical protein